MNSFQKFLKTKGAILEFKEYYYSYRKEIIQVLEYYKEKNYIVAIWGAGLKGTSFLNLMDEKGEYIDYVIDMNDQLHNTYITPNHRVVSVDDAIKDNINVVIIMNSDHYADNYSLLHSKGFKQYIIDLDYLIENRADPMDVIKGKYNFSSNKHYDLSQIHMRIMDILMGIDRICKANNITYFLSAGTALGAIRHKGFVPWDDDADIGMLREDFERFRKIAKNELGHQYYYQRMRKTNDFYRAFDQIGLKDTSFVIYNTKDLKMYHGIHVDIFPFDNVSEIEQKREEHVKQVQFYRNKLYQKQVPHVTTTNNILKKLIINHEYYFKKLVPYKYLYKKMNKTLKRYDNLETKYIADLLTHYKKIMYFKKDDIIPVRYTEFEGVQLPIPNNPHEYLKMMYGDYMTPPPEGKRNQRHKIVKLSCNEAYEKDTLT